MDTRKPFNLSKNNGRNWRDIDVLAYLCHCDIARWSLTIAFWFLWRLTKEERETATENSWIFRVRMWESVVE